MRAALEGHRCGRVLTATSDEVFDQFDKDGSGDIDVGELTLITAAMGNLMSPDDLQAVFDEIDEDGAARGC